eukprot:6640604-Alexandrium_andersonii.AAC.1
MELEGWAMYLGIQALRNIQLTTSGQGLSIAPRCQGRVARQKHSEVLGSGPSRPQLYSSALQASAVA